MPSLSLAEDIFTAKPGRWKSVARIATAVALAELVTLTLLEGSTFWPMLTVLILSVKNVGMTWQKSVQRMIGTGIGFFLAIMLVAMFPQTPGALLLSFVPIFLVCIYMFQTDATNPYAFFMVVVTMTVVISPAWLDPELVSERGLARFTDTLIGILCITFVSRCVFPVTAEDELKKAMQGSLTRADERFSAICQLLAGNTASDSAIVPESRTDFSEKVDLLNAAISESKQIHDTRGVWMARINLSHRVAVQSELLLEELTPSELDRIPLDFRQRMIQCVQIIQDSWRMTGRSLLAGEIPEVKQESMDAIADDLEDARLHGQGVKRVNAVTTVILMLRQIDQTPDIISYHGSLQGESKGKQYGLVMSARKMVHNLHMPALKMAVKATLSTMVALILVATLRWENAMLTTAVTAIIVIQPTLGATWSKAFQRLFGATIGCSLGIVGLAIVAANTNDVTWWLVYLAFSMGIAAWMMGGSWEISYIGLQIGLAVAIVLGHAVGPTTDVKDGIGRVAGILFGVAITLVILRLLWPVFAGSQVCAAMATASRAMANYLELGLKDPEKEAALRPKGGWNFLISSNIAHAYQFRAEARYERGIKREHAVPGLNLGSRLQSTLPKVVLIVEARQLRALREEIVQHPAIKALRNGIEGRLRLIADVVEGGEGTPDDLHTLVASAYEAMGPSQQLPEGTDRKAIEEFLGYYSDMILDLDLMVDDARQVAELFSSSKGLPMARPT
ncbi:MAG: FUSC family protein [Planctomycetota bacterium]|nr:FUSC family protein [Planctomycetota bacterium]